MADDQNLAALQQLLQSQTNGQAPAVSATTQTTGADQAPPPAEPENVGPTREEIVEMEKQKEAEEEKQIEEQIQKMKTEIKDTPQYKAMLEQKQTAEQEDEEKRREERSKTIFQLKHLDK